MEQRPGVRADQIDVQTVFDHLAEGVVVLDEDRNIVLMNDSAARLLGVEQGPHSRGRMAETFEVRTAQGDTLAAEQWPSAVAMRGEFMDEVERQLIRRKTGEVAHAVISTIPIKDSSGRMVQVLLLYRDITERKQFDAVRTQLAAIVESSEDAIIGKNGDGIVSTWNRGAEKIFGYTAEEMVGQSIKRLLPADRQDEEDGILARIKHGEKVDPFETRRVRKDGTEIVVSLAISPIRDGNGKIVGASKVARDITAQRRLERQVQQSHRMEAIGQLTGGIAHDFNNLLGVVIGNLDLMEGMIADHEAASKRLRTAQRAAMRGAALTRRLLAFSSAEQLHPKLTSLEHSIRNTLELAQRGLGPEIRMVTEIDRSVPEVMVDVAGLESLLLNLFVNARDAMPEGGTLTVSSRVRRIERDYPAVQTGELAVGAYACVTVSDTGCGMSRETLERAFEPFYTTKPRGRGTGLGLAMAYGFIRQSGGTVQIYSEVGYGTSVSFYLPLAAAEAERIALEEAEAAATARSFGECTVLIVDDEEDLLELAGVYVEQMGCRALKAIDGASALAILESAERVDAMVTDVIMPGGMSGAALAERARVLRPEMKIIYCSGFPSDALADRTFSLQDGPLLRKPYQRADMQAMVRNALEGKGPGTA